MLLRLPAVYRVLPLIPCWPHWDVDIARTRCHAQLFMFTYLDYFVYANPPALSFMLDSQGRAHVGTSWQPCLLQENLRWHGSRPRLHLPA